MSIPKLIHFIVPPKLSAMQQRAIALARALHNDWDVKVWNDEQIKDFPPLDVYGPRCQSGAQRADLLRLALIHEFGGAYFDSDILLRRSIEFLSTYDCFATSSQDGMSICNAFFAAPPRHRATESLIAYLVSNEPSWTHPECDTTGPGLFSRLLRYRDDVTLLPREVFYPYNFGEPRPDVFPPMTYGVHEWAASWVSPVTASAARPPRPGPWQQLRRNVGRFLANRLRVLLAEALPRTAPNGNCFWTGTHLVARHSLGHFLALDPLDRSVTPAVALNGGFELAVESFILDHVRGGDWFVDVGANVGVHSILAGMACGPFGRVFSIEANPDTVEFITHSASLNWIQDRLSVLPLAASDHEGEVQLEGSKERRGEFRVRAGDRDQDGFARHSGSLSSVQTVPCQRLDRLFPHDLPIAVMKIDVEGHEDAVLRGGSRLLSSGAVANIVLEYGTESYGSRFAMYLKELARVEGYGYQPFKLHLDEAGKCHLIHWPEYPNVPPVLGHVPLVLRRDASWTSSAPAE